MTKALAATAMTRSADFVRTAHHVVVPVDVTMEDVTRPSFWAHHTGRLGKHDIVDVLSEDGSFDMQLRVVDKGVGFVEMRVLREWQREGAAAEEAGDLPDVPDGYIVNHAPKTGWRVLTKEPHLEISRNHKSRREATEVAIVHAAKAAGLTAA